MTTINENPSESTSKPHRRWRPRLTIRVMLVMVVVVSLGLGVWVKQARKQASAALAVQRSGGMVMFTDQIESRPFGDYRLVGWQPIPGPVLLRQFLGDEYFRTISTVTLYEDPGYQKARFLKAMNALTRIGSLTRLTVSGAEAAEESVRYIDNLPNLEYLCFLVATRIGDAQARQIARSRTIRNLTMRASVLTEEGVIALAAIPSLEVLQLEGPQLSDRALIELGKLTGLTELAIEIDPQKISSHGVDALKKIKTLRRLVFLNKFLNQTDVDAFIEAMPQLVWISLHESGGGVTYYTSAELAKRREQIRQEKLRPKP